MINEKTKTSSFLVEWRRVSEGGQRMDDLVFLGIQWQRLVWLPSSGRGHSTSTLNDFESICLLCHFPKIFRWLEKLGGTLSFFQLVGSTGESYVVTDMQSLAEANHLCFSEDMPQWTPKPTALFFLKKVIIIFICLFCIHFQLMLQGKMLETKCLCLTMVELGRDSNASNALSRAKTMKHYNCTCMPTAFIFTIDCFLFVCDAADLFFTFKQRCERKHVICLAAQPSTCQISHQQSVSN